MGNKQEEMNEEIEQRFVDLEIKVSYQENTIAELNSVVFNQQRQIDDLTETCTELTRIVKGISGQAGLSTGTPENEKPPHY